MFRHGHSPKTVSQIDHGNLNAAVGIHHYPELEDLRAPLSEMAEHNVMRCMKSAA
jgi:hypothetical protein